DPRVMADQTFLLKLGQPAWSMNSRDRLPTFAASASLRVARPTARRGSRVGRRTGQSSVAGGPAAARGPRAHQGVGVAWQSDRDRSAGGRGPGLMRNRIGAGVAFRLTPFARLLQPEGPLGPPLNDQGPPRGVVPEQARNLVCFAGNCFQNRFLA